MGHSPRPLLMRYRRGHYGLPLAGWAVVAAVLAVVGLVPVSFAAPLPSVAPTVCGGNPAIAVNGSPLRGLAPLPVSFSSTVSGGCAPYQVAWQFGDGEDQDGLAVNHTYGGAGSYSVLATAQDSNGLTASASLAVVVLGGSGPLAVTVQAAPLAGPAPLAVTFWANVTGGYVAGNFSSSWSFGDGGHGTGTPITHTYAAKGNYLTTVVVRDAREDDATASASVLVNASGGGPPAVNLSLSVSPTSGPAPLDVNVSVFSNGEAGPYALGVCYGDGTVCSTEPSGWNGSSPIQFNHTYATAGNYTITAALAGSFGSTVIGTTAAVTVLPEGSPIAVTAAADRTSGTTPLTVEFTAVVIGGNPPYSILWRFGDGAVGSSIPGQPVGHTYTNGGKYSPLVVVTDASGGASNATLPTVTVSTSETSFAGLPGSYFGIPTDYLAGAALGAGIAIVIVVGRRLVRGTRDRRLRREGEEIVRELEHPR